MLYHGLVYHGSTIQTMYERTTAVTILRESLETSLPIEQAFATIADFSNAPQWDPGVATAERLDGGLLGVGARFRLRVRIGPVTAPMDYVVATWDPPYRVVLTGRGSGVAAIDDIRFKVLPSGTRIDYQADIRLRGPLRLLEPFAGGAFDRIARNARDGMQRALDRLAATA